MPSGKNLTDEEKFKWREILAFMKQNPEIMLDLMPDNVNINFRENNKTQHRKGYSMIPELGVVPPQSQLGSNKMGIEDDSMISYRKNQNLSTFFSMIVVSFRLLLVFVPLSLLFKAATLA